MCLYPRMITNRRYIANKKNGGNIPPVKDERTKLVAIGCGECIECRRQKARGWQVRLLEDIKTNRNGIFVTLTFSNEKYTELAEDIIQAQAKEGKETATGYTLDNLVATRAMRYFNENWRAKYGKAIRHWIVTELGHEGTENVHMHGIMWTDKGGEAIRNMWGKMYGFTWTGKYVNGATVNYIIKYVTKLDLQHKTFKSIILTSPGIGGNYMQRRDWMKNKFNGKETEEAYRTSTGNKVAMPTYWRNKIYSEEEREQLWIQKLDEQIRWVCGEKIDISKGEKEYYKILAYHRSKNKQLGYGTGTKDWNRETYERERRIILQKQRLRRGNSKDINLDSRKRTPAESAGNIAKQIGWDGEIQEI